MKASNEFLVGEIAERAGVNLQTLRFYEKKGMLKARRRSNSGYRLYDEESLKRLLFILHAKELGFSLNEISEILSLRVSSAHSCGRVKERAEKKLLSIRGKLEQLRHLEKTLMKLIKSCNNRKSTSACPILDHMEVEE